MAISGNATTAEGLPADFVRIFSWPTSELVGVAIPDESGDWSHEIPLTGEYGLTYIASGCQPITHGPYYIEVDTDPHWGNVVALLHFDGDLTDETGRVWGEDGGPVVSGSSAHFGSGGLRIDGLDSGVNTSYFLDNDTQSFTAEVWMRIGDYTGPKMPGPGIYRHTVFSQHGSGSSRDQALFIDGGKLKLEQQAALKSPAVSADGTSLVPLNEFFHVAISYDGTHIRAFLDGALEIEVPTTKGWINSGLPFMLGRSYNPSFSQYRTGSNADFDDLRITKGVARYTESFTPSSGPFQNTGPA